MEARGLQCAQSVTISNAHHPVTRRHCGRQFTSYSLKVAAVDNSGHPFTHTWRPLVLHVYFKFLLLMLVMNH